MLQATTDNILKQNLRSGFISGGPGGLPPSGIDPPPPPFRNWLSLYCSLLKLIAMRLLPLK